MRGGDPIADASARHNRGVSLSGLVACGVSLVIGLPVLLRDPGPEPTTVAAVDTTAPVDVGEPLLESVDVTAMFDPGARVLASDLIDEPADSAVPLAAVMADNQVAGSPSAATTVPEPERSSTTQVSAAAAPDPSAPTTAAPTTAPPTTAAPTTAPSTTAPPTTAAPTTAPPTTASPTTEPPTTAAPTTTAPGQTDPPQTAPAGGPSPEQWNALRQCESNNNYSIVSSNGLYHGAYQFGIPTWNGTAAAAGRADLVGVLPSQASAADQDAMAAALYSMRGRSPWPHCGRHLA